MTTFPIPYDVLDNVFAFLDRRALVSVCLANKFLNFAATRALYGREITINPWTSKWKISPTYASMIRTVIWKETAYRWYYPSESKHLIQQPFPSLPALRAFRWSGVGTRNDDLLIRLFLELTKIETLQEITLPSQHWNLIRNSDGWKEALDRSRVVRLGGLPLHLLDQLSARILQRLISIKPNVSRHSADSCQPLVLVTRLRELEFETNYDLGEDAKLLEAVGKLRNLQTLRLAFRCCTSGGDITIMSASLPHLRHLSLVIRRRPGTSTKNAAHLVKMLTADAALETLDLQCDYKGWDTSAIYRAIKRHSKTLRMLCAPGWYAHTAMLQALDKFLLLEDVTIGRIAHLEVDILRDFKRIQRVYLYNHQHSPPLPTGEIKVLLLQSESSIHTFGECVYTDKAAQSIDIWRAQWTYDSILERPRRNIVRETQKALESTILP